MKQVINRVNHVIRNEASVRQTGIELLKEFRALYPETVIELVGVWQAEQWIRQMDLIFETIECTDIEKRRWLYFN